MLPKIEWYCHSPLSQESPSETRDFAFAVVAVAAASAVAAVVSAAAACSEDPSSQLRSL